MKLLKIIGLFCLFCFTFLYTEKIINVSMDQDEIMIKIKDEATHLNTPPTDAIITNDTIIPGKIGKEVSLEPSYKAMKKLDTTTLHFSYIKISILKHLSTTIIIYILQMVLNIIVTYH